MQCLVFVSLRASHNQLPYLAGKACGNKAVACRRPVAGRAGWRSPSQSARSIKLVPEPWGERTRPPRTACRPNKAARRPCRWRGQHLWKRNGDFVRRSEWNFGASPDGYWTTWVVAGSKMQVGRLDQLQGTLAKHSPPAWACLPAPLVWAGQHQALGKLHVLSELCRHYKYF